MFLLYLIIVLMIFGASIFLIIKQDKQQKQDFRERESVIKGLQRENERLKQEIATLSKRSQEKPKEINELEQQLQQKTIEFEKIEKTLKDEQQSKAEINKTVNNIEKQFNDKNNEIQKLQTELKKLRDDNEKAQDEIKKINDDFSQLDKTAKIKIKLKDDEIAKLKNELELLKQSTQKPQEEKTPVSKKPVEKKEEKTVSEKLFQVKPSGLTLASAVTLDNPLLAKPEENKLIEKTLPQQLTSIENGTKTQHPKESSLKKIVKEVLEKEKTAQEFTTPQEPKQEPEDKTTNQNEKKSQ